MIRRLFFAAALAGAGTLAVKSWPDLQRYLKMRQM
jgi:hypothetical protein